MKLFTSPRPLTVGLLRKGDHVALRPDGAPMQTPSEYVDHDLRGKVRWTVVERDPMPRGGIYPVITAHVTLDLPRDHPVIVREALELDPWTYVERVDQLPPRQRAA